MVLIECLNLVLLYCSILIFKGFYFTISHGVKNILGRFPSTHNAMVELVSMVLTMILTFVGSHSLSMNGKIIFSLCFCILKTLTISKYTNKFRLFFAKMVLCGPKYSELLCFFTDDRDNRFVVQSDFLNYKITFIGLKLLFICLHHCKFLFLWMEKFLHSWTRDSLFLQRKRYQAYHWSCSLL